MKTIKQWFNKIKVFVMNILKGLLNVVKETKKETKKTIDNAIKTYKEILKEKEITKNEIAKETIDKSFDLLKQPFKRIKNIMDDPTKRRNYGLVIMGFGIGVGGSLYLSSFGGNLNA